MLDTEFISQLKRWHLVSNEGSRIVIGNKINDCQLALLGNDNNTAFNIAYVTKVVFNPTNTTTLFDDPIVDGLYLSIIDVVRHINEDIDYVLTIDD